MGRAERRGGTRADDVGDLPDAAFDDVVYFGASKPTIDVLNDKLATRGIINVVLGGATIGAPVSVGVGRVHYEATRWIGTAGFSAAESYATIPPCGELRTRREPAGRRRGRTDGPDAHLS